MSGPVASTRPHHGTVAAFDAQRGLGTVEDEGGTSYGFHATAVADGSRRIAVGTSVVFTVSPGHLGRYEAASLVSAPS